MSRVAPRWLPGEALTAGASPYLFDRLICGAATLRFAAERSGRLAIRAGAADPASPADVDAARGADALAGAAIRATGGVGAALRDFAPLALSPELKAGQSARTPADPDPVDGLDRARTVIAAVDLGPAFAHARFRGACGGSRFDFLWQQDAAHDRSVHGPAFGRLWRGPALDGLVRQAGADEAAAYRAARLIDMARPEARWPGRAGGHGTAVLDLAGGADPGRRDGDALDADPGAFPLAAVGLPEAVIADTSGAFTSFFVIAGIDALLRHVAARGRARGRPLPVVVVVALGLTGGAKDGRGTLERYLADVAAVKLEGLGPVRFVLPSGNHRQSRLRAVADPSGSAPAWRLPPDDATPSFLEIWARPRAARPETCGLALTVSPPGGPEATLIAPALDRVHALDRDGRTLLRALAQWVPDDPCAPDGPGRERITLVAPPTRPDASGADVATPGDWALSLAETAPGDPRLPADLFIQRDDTLTGEPRRGRQSRFVDPAYRPRDDRGAWRMDDDPGAMVRRIGTLNAYATGAGVTVAGGIVARDPRAREGRPAFYSGTGPGEPDAWAPCERSAAMPGVLAAGGRSGSRRAWSGVSMAAPVVARRIAAEMAEAPRAPHAAPWKKA